MSLRPRISILQSCHYSPKLLSIAEVESYQRFSIISSTAVLYCFRNPDHESSYPVRDCKGDTCEIKYHIRPSLRLHPGAKQ
ncbi:uncharacterized protein Bfra_001653 [Botrytis fragariae]|uniref:Uncharacterized protein n=1 Tax=Botrytis fragariae TaxID=1964551 RepID=A0A8H6B175_9HELO|nr:uncharacterized protein Bfra_001653 [Botrytis fragariae]KAF5877285.1 hypothetical protein Bfra_001653 [Botrytis fragariae]